MRAFLFDLDDTLFDHAHSTRVALGAIQQHLPTLAALTLDDLEAQHAVVLEELHQQVLAGTLDVDGARITRFRRLVTLNGGDPAPGEIESAARAYRAAYLQARRAVAGAVPLLRALRGHARIAVISNNVQAEQVQKMFVCGLQPLVDTLVVSEEVGFAKPDPKIFRVALERIEATARDAVMIGDSWSADIAGARAAGIRAAWFNPRRRPCPDLAAIVAEIDAWEPTGVVMERMLGW